MKTPTKLSLLALGILIPAASIPLLVKAADSNSNVNNGQTQTRKAKSMMRGQGALSESERLARHEAIENAINNNDYNAWLKAVGSESQLAKNVSQEEFPVFIEAHKLMLQAQEKLKTIGLDGMGMKNKMKNFPR